MKRRCIDDLPRSVIEEFQRLVDDELDRASIIRDVRCLALDEKQATASAELFTEAANFWLRYVEALREPPEKWVRLAATNVIMANFAAMCAAGIAGHPTKYGSLPFPTIHRRSP